MAGLTYHKTLTAPTDYAQGESGLALMAKKNSNEDTLLADAQAVENRLEDLVYELHDSGVLSGMVASIGSGLSVGVTAGSAVVGLIVDYAGGAVSVLANQTNANLYFAQDGNFYTAAPSSLSYFTFCTYTSNGSAVTTVGTTKKILPCSLQTVTDTFKDLHVGSSHTLEYEIDHSATIEFSIPGFISLSVSPAAAFTVVHINQEEDTGGVFNVRISRGEDYQTYSQYFYNSGVDYGPYALCDLTFTRTGMGVN